jgi:hypothetical protein
MLRWFVPPIVIPLLAALLIAASALYQVSLEWMDQEPSQWEIG